MKRLSRHTRLTVLAATLVGTLIAALLPIAANRGEPREIEIEIRDMAFHLAGESAPNPEIRVAAGEEIIFVVRNDDSGIVHDFSVPAWERSTRRLRTGESDRLVFRAPRQKGTTPYFCTPHSAMMRGTLVVE